MITIEKMKKADNIWRAQLHKQEILDIFNSVTAEYGYPPKKTLLCEKPDSFCYYFTIASLQFKKYNRTIGIAITFDVYLKTKYSLCIYDYPYCEDKTYVISMVSLKELKDKLKYEFKRLELLTYDEIMIKDIIE